MEEHVGSSFGSVLRFFRRRINMTQENLARKLKVHVNSIGLWERDEKLPESHEVVLNIAKYLLLDEEGKRLLLEARYGTASIEALYNVPFEPNPYFTGRETLLRQLHEKLTTQKQVALKQAISGIGGVGKTQTALEYIYRYRESYHDIFWVDASSFETVTSSYIKLAKLLHLREKNLQDQNLIVGAVKRWLSTHEKWLLILDNVEDFGLVNTFVPPGRQGTVLLTTQSQFTEPVAQSIEIDCMIEEEGGLFLLRRAHLLSLDSVLDEASPDNVSKAMEISRVLGGLPLALDQAGAYIKETDCTLLTYLALYMERRAELLQERGDIPTDHPDSVTTTFSLAFDRVKQKHGAAPELLRFFAFLAPDNIPEELVFDGGKHLGPILQSISADEYEYNKVIKALRAFSLIQHNTQKKVLSIHRLVQAILQDTMELSEKKEWIKRGMTSVHYAFPSLEPEEWSRCERLIPHVYVFMTQIQSWKDIDKDSFFWKSIGEIWSFLMLNASTYMRARGQYSAAELLFQHIFQIIKKANDSQGFYVEFNNFYLAQLCYHRGDNYLAQGQWLGAESYFKKSMSLLEGTEDTKDFNVSIPIQSLAELYRRIGKEEDAELLFQKSWRIREQRLGSENPKTTIPLFNLASLYMQQGKLVEAESLLQRILHIKEKHFGSEHLELAFPLDHLGQIYRNQGKFAEAESSLLRALHIRKQFLGLNHHRTASSFTSLAELYLNQDKDLEAKSLFQQALYIQYQIFKFHPQMLATIHGLADSYKKQNQYLKAEGLLQVAVFIAEVYLLPEHPGVNKAWSDFLTVCNHQERFDQAESLFRIFTSLREDRLGLLDTNTARLRKMYTDLSRNTYQKPDEATLNEFLHNVEQSLIEEIQEVPIANILAGNIIDGDQASKVES